MRRPDQPYRSPARAFGRPLGRDPASPPGWRRPAATSPSGQDLFSTFAGMPPGAGAMAGPGLGGAVAGPNPFNPALSQMGAAGTLGTFQMLTGAFPNPSAMNPAAAGPTAGGGGAPGPGGGATINISVATITIQQATINVQGGAGAGGQGGPGGQSGQGGAGGMGGAGGSGAGAGLGGFLGGLAGGYGAYKAAEALVGLAGVGSQISVSGGDITSTRAALMTAQALPFSQFFMPIIGPQLEKLDQLQGASATLRMLGQPTTGLQTAQGGLDTGLASSYVEAMRQAALQGISLPESMRQRFEQPEGIPGSFRPGQMGGMMDNPAYVHPAMRGQILSAYQRARLNPYAVGAYGMGDISEMGGVSAPSRMADLALTGGDYETARELYGFEGDQEGLLRTNRQQQQRTAADLGLRRAGLAADLTDATRRTLLGTGFGTAGQAAIGATYAASAGLITDQQRQLEQQSQIAQENLQRARDRGNPADMLQANDQLQQLAVQRQQLDVQRAGLAQEQAGTPFTTGLRSALSSSQYTIQALENIPGAFGNIRGALQGQMGLLERAAGQLDAVQGQMQRAGTLTPEAALTLQERRQQVGLQEAQTFEQLNIGWMDRLISRVQGDPHVVNLNARVSFLDAVRAGVVNPGMGTGRGNLPFFMRQAGLTPAPVNPFFRGPNPDFGDRPGVFGGPDPFEPAAGGVPGSGVPVPQEPAEPGGTAPAQAAAGGYGGAMPVHPAGAHPAAGPAGAHGRGGPGGTVQVSGEVTIRIEDANGRPMGQGRGRAQGNLNFNGDQEGYRQYDDQRGRGSRQG